MNKKQVARQIRAELKSLGYSTNPRQVMPRADEIIGEAIYRREQEYQIVRLTYDESGVTGRWIVRFGQDDWFTQDRTFCHQVYERSDTVWQSVEVIPPALDSWSYRSQRAYSEMKARLKAMKYNPKMVGLVSSDPNNPEEKRRLNHITAWAMLRHPDVDDYISLNTQVYFDDTGKLIRCLTARFEREERINQARTLSWSEIDWQEVDEIPDPRQLGLLR